MSDAFSEAIVKIPGYGQSASQQINNVALDPLVRHRVDQVFEFADSLRPDWSALDLVGAGARARGEIAQRFPFLLPEALDALAWSCTFGWK
jgi:hypothetical protein